MIRTAAILLTVILSAAAVAADDDRQKERTPVERMIETEVVVAAPVADVWQAWTTRDGLRSFFGADALIELRPGGPFEIYFVPDAPVGQRGSEGCQVLAFLPQKMLAFSWNAPPSIPTIRGERTQVVVLFEPRGPNQTRVRLVHHGWGTGDDWDKAFTYFSKAWPSVLASLEKRLGPADKGRPQFVYFIEPARPTFLQDATEEENARVAEHFKYLQLLLADGTLILAGRTVEDQPTGIVVFEAADLDTARQIMANDPAVRAGVFKARLAPYRVALQRP